MACNVSAEQLWSWVDRGAPELQEHLAVCATCRALAEECRRGIASVARATNLVEAPLPTQIGAYEIKRLVGQGGQALVYEAQQQSPRRRVALKVLRGGALAGEEQRRHFNREIQTLAALQHPGIATIYEAGCTADGLSYFAMEFVTGIPLDRYAVQAGRPLSERVDLMRKVCAAVEYAHEQGVIHRDLKPSNILVTPERTPKVLDFGLAKLRETEATIAAAATAVGQVLGTLQYMSPEQARGGAHDVGRTTDVYALGVILYEMVSGQPPYSTQAPFARAVETICTASPRRLSSINRTLTGDLETIVQKALEKEPGRRYASVGELGADLGRYLNHEPIHARPASGAYVLRRALARHRTAAVLSVAAVVLGILGLGGGALWNRHVQAIHRTDEEAAALAGARRELLMLLHRVEVGGDRTAVGGAELLWRQYPRLRESTLVLAQALFRDADIRSPIRATELLTRALQEDPTRTECAALLGEHFAQAGDQTRAREYEAQAERDVPMTAEGWYLRSMATLDGQAALECARRATDLAPAWRFAWIRRAHACARRHAWDEALRAADELVRYDAATWGLFRGGVLARLDRLQDALEQYTRLAEGTDRELRASALFGRGHVQRRLGRFTDAVADYSESIGLRSPESALWTLYERSAVLCMVGRPEQAAEDYRRFRAVLGRPSYADARWYIVLRDLGREAEAQQVLRDALRPVTEPWLKSIFRCLAGELPPEELIRIARESESAEQACEGYYYAGEYCRLNGRQAAARADFEACVQTNAIYVEASFPDPMNEYELAAWRLGEAGDAKAGTLGPSSP